MVWFWQEQQKKKQREELLLAFFQEVENNFEAYYVMFQINRLRFFPMDVWFRVKDAATIAVDDKIQKYIQCLTEYNEVLTDFKEYEKWYSSNIKHKTKENGIVLQTKRDAAQAKFDVGLEGIIKSALTSLQDQLLAVNVLKQKSRFLERA